MVCWWSILLWLGTWCFAPWDVVPPPISPAQYDLRNDASITRFVGPWEPFHVLSYRPNDLVKILPDSPEKPSPLIAAQHHYLRQEARDQLYALSKDLYEKTAVPLKVTSAWRSYEHQRRITERDDHCVDHGFCALPGHSEHQSGLAIDVFDASTEEAFFLDPKALSAWRWMRRNAWKYGWVQSYRMGREVDGYEHEPWHWRYLGVGLARELFIEKQTFTQWRSERNELHQCAPLPR